MIRDQPTLVADAVAIDIQSNVVWSDAELMLWHKRLRHVSIKKLQ